MRFKFEPDLDHQVAAIEAVCDLFCGQEVCRNEFAVSHGLVDANSLGFEEHELGIGNRLSLRHEALHANLRQVQRRNGLLESASLDSPDFTVEMETGTGKTYVYLRTIFELNKRYGFRKFAIVVPSIAIKEGVNKSLKMMDDHLRSLYSGTPFEPFVYDSRNLQQVRNFAVSTQLQIMLITVGAINKQRVNTIYQEHEKTGGEKPIKLIRATRPILIVDEPQSVEGGLWGRGKEALKSMNPLCTLRYSATHVDKYHMVYRLNPVDAYQRNLVKQIEVAAGTLQDDVNRPFVGLKSIQQQGHAVAATVQIDVETKGGVRRRDFKVLGGEDLESLTGRAIYHGHQIGAIDARPKMRCMELRSPSDVCWLEEGEAYGAVDNVDVHRSMIRKTIWEHFEKEKQLNPQRIKVLSLFFVQEVAHYRQYDSDGNIVKGSYALMFEEEFRSAANHPENRALFEGVDVRTAAEEAHDGYFSIDKRERWVDTKENTQADRDNAERAYGLIMRDKEKLLSFEVPLRFIFSHSALKEGWDNPNVFQICALRDMHAEQQRRQAIGRGLRLCVDQDGQRQRDSQINILTVVARESYEEFARNLQQEIERETGFRFGVVDLEFLTTIAAKGDVRYAKPLSVEQAGTLLEYLKKVGYLDARNRITESLNLALEDDDLNLPRELDEMAEPILEALRRASEGIRVRDRRRRRRARPREAILNNTEFKALWDRIKHKTKYRLKFDNEDLIAKCTEALADAPTIPAANLQWTTVEIKVEQSGLHPGKEQAGLLERLPVADVDLPDLLTELQNRTSLTRRSIQRILSNSGRLFDFRVNPQRFIEVAAKEINRRKQHLLVNGIRYQRLGSDEFYAQELFETEELVGYLTENMLESQKSVFDYVVCDSKGERQFARKLEDSVAVKVYAKLPNWFKVPTPLGTYNPDWAVLVGGEEGERLYLVLETKGSTFEEDLRGLESAKIECGKKHFAALELGEFPSGYHVVSSWRELQETFMEPRPYPVNRSNQDLARVAEQVEREYLSNSN